MSQSTAAKDGVAVRRPVSRKDMSMVQWTLKEIRRNYLAYLMLAPFYILFCVFTVVPVIASLVISFTDFNMLEAPNFVFMDNYVRLFLDDDLFHKRIHLRHSFDLKGPRPVSALETRDSDARAGRAWPPLFRLVYHTSKRLFNVSAQKSVNDP